jgi:hypothetical protein
MTFMGFPPNDVAKLLVDCKRRCSICHRFCGIKIETDHIVPKSEKGTDSIENAIPLCFDCHAEVQLYNPKHPRGRKYTSEELSMHKKNRIELCKSSPQLFIQAPENAQSGPLSGLVTELEFNLRCSTKDGSQFETIQFRNAISDGILSLLDEELRNLIMDTYAELMINNQKKSRLLRMESESSFDYKEESRKLQSLRQPITAVIAETLNRLRAFINADR